MSTENSLSYFVKNYSPLLSDEMVRKYDNKQVSPAEAQEGWLNDQQNKFTPQRIGTAIEPESERLYNDITSDLAKVYDTLDDRPEAEDLIERIGYKWQKRFIKEVEKGGLLSGRELIATQVDIIKKANSEFMKHYIDATRKYQGFSQGLNQIKINLAEVIEVNKDSSDVKIKTKELLLHFKLLQNKYLTLNDIILYPDIEHTGISNNYSEVKVTGKYNGAEEKDKEDANKWIKNLGLPVGSLMDVDKEIDKLSKLIEQWENKPDIPKEDNIDKIKVKEATIKEKTKDLEDKIKKLASSGANKKKLEEEIRKLKKEILEDQSWIDDKIANKYNFKEIINKNKEKLEEVKTEYNNANKLEEIKNFIKDIKNRIIGMESREAQEEQIEKTKAFKHQLENLDKKYIVTIDMSPLENMIESVKTLGDTDEVTVNPARENAWRTGLDTQFEAVNTVISVLTQKTTNAKNILDFLIKVLSDIIQKEAETQSTIIRSTA